MNIEQCVHHYSDYLFHIAYMYTKDRFDAEEIVQDVFLKLHNSNQFEGRSSLKTYLTTMTINRSYDYLRKKTMKKLISLDYWSKSSKSSERYMIEQYEQDTIIQAILQLPTKYREVIFLYYYDEQKTEQIARLLNIASSTVRTRLQRGRQQLKQQLHVEDWEVFKNE